MIWRAVFAGGKALHARLGEMGGLDGLRCLARHFSGGAIQQRRVGWNDVKVWDVGTGCFTPNVSWYLGIAVGRLLRRLYGTV